MKGDNRMKKMQVLLALLSFDRVPMASLQLSLEMDNENAHKTVAGIIQSFEGAQSIITNPVILMCDLFLFFSLTE